ncbi:unnamed protein product [Paramecium octaurelia]|uniref:26S proteasome non-ATPase regulatory subunit 1 homolog n=1 Tax=Paramecium octaurelia TaxID=43137 RepID=A0A8S1S3A0_PAROT|nr:unnamed protein product [Paramecium octaurelia]
MNFNTLLLEKDNDLRILALKEMLNQVDQHWSEISELLSQIESLSEDPKFPERQLASYLCAKIQYHLDNFDESLNYALQSGHYWQSDLNDKFNQCLIKHCVEQYRQSGKATEERISLIKHILELSCGQNNHISAIGVAVECKRIDWVAEILNKWKYPGKMISVLHLFNTQRGQFKEQLLRLSVDLIYEEAKQGQIPNEEWGQFVTVLIQLGEAIKVAEILWTLVINENHYKLQTGTPLLLAEQLCIDLAQNQKPQFIQKIIAALPIDQQFQEVRDKLIKLLSGEQQRKAYLYFLKNHRQVDVEVLNKIKGSNDPKQSSVLHGACMFGHALATAGTQDTSFLQANQQWATKCNYWQRFTATSTLGMINKYNIEESQQIMAAHLSQTNPFEIGGALYGLGLIHFGTQDQQLLLKLSDYMKSQKEQIIHGACLGSGLIAFASEDEKLNQDYHNLVSKNESVYGEGASIGFGLLNAGSGSIEQCKRLLVLAGQSDKDKIVRTLSLSIACILFHQEDKADVIIDQMLQSNDPLIRYGGCFTLAFAYVGTGSNKIIQKLLSISVNDVSEDVRRAAVISFGFLMFKNYESLPKIMRLLTLSYNPHIRYGTAIALGIACAGTLYADALSAIEPMLTDTVDFVRQGALIALGMILSQGNKDQEPKFEPIMKSINEIAAKKHETVLTKLGLAIFQGLLDCGGRNLTVSLQSRQGVPKLNACVGMLWFLNYWYWYPCLSMISVALQPVSFIGLNENLDIPKDFQLQCNTKQSVFDYPPPQKKSEKPIAEKKTVQLSTTQKVRARTNKKDLEKKQIDSASQGVISREQSKMSLEQQPSEIIRQPSLIEEQEKKQAAPKDEPNQYILTNPCRILDKQKKHIQLLEGSRYQPLLKDRKQGLVMLIDSEPSQSADVISLTVKPKQPIIEQVVNQQPAPPNQVPEEFVFDEALQNEEQKQ